ncbi:MAG: hypothetical protein QXN59_00430 [Candidatus Micrarchaeaceae archaeon]
MAKRENNSLRYGAFVLELIASLIFMGLAFTQSGNYSAAGWSAAALWLPLFYSAAIIGSVALFFISFGSLLMPHEHMAHAAACATVAAGFSLVALTFGNLPMYIVAIVAFILGIIGSGLNHPM